MRMKVSTIMSQTVIALQPGDKLTSAIELMRKKNIRHLPIVSKRGDFLGLLSHRDLLAASASFLYKEYAERQREILARTPVEELMHKDVVTTTPDADLREVARQMKRSKYGCLPVLRGKTLAGIVTASDFLGLSINLLTLYEKFEKARIGISR